MRRSGFRVLLAVLASVALVGACGGSDDDDAAAKKSGENASTESSLPTDSTLAPGGDTTLPGAPGGPTTTARRGTTATTRAGAQPPAAQPATPPPPAPAGVKMAAPGKYTYDVTGTSPLGGSPGPAMLTIDPPTGADQRSVLSGNQGSTETILRYQPDGAYLVFLKLTTPAKEFRPAQPVLAAPSPAAVGRTWSWEIKSTDGATTVKSDFKVVRNETVAIGGEQVPTVVIDAVVTISGDFAATDKRTMWISDAYRLIVKQDDVVDVTKPIVAHSETKATLRSTKPA